MIDNVRHRIAARRIKPGSGRPLKPFRWWQLPFRALFHLQLPRPDGRHTRYTLDIPHRADTGGGKARAHLYLDGQHHAESTLPAVFPVQGGTIEVAISAFGIKRCHYVTAGRQHQLVPDDRSAEGRRARFARHHPALSRSLAFLSVAVLFTGVGLNLLQLAEPASQIPQVTEWTGRFESPVHLPIWLNLTLAIGAVLASTERALRLRHSLLDNAGR